MEYLARQRAGLARRLKILRQQNNEIRERHYSESMTTVSIADTYDGDGCENENSVLELCEVVDTALLRIYIELNHPLIGSLLRVKNYCNIDFTESILRKKNVSQSKFIF